MKIIETLDYGMSLLEDGSVLKADGSIMSREAYEASQQYKAKNRLDWNEIDVNEFVDLLEESSFATKTYDIEQQQQGMAISKQGFACVDKEGSAFYLRAQEFSGAEKFEIAQVSFSQLIYNVDKNSTEQAFEALTDILQNLFGVDEQVGSIFAPDDETEYLIKKFIHNGYAMSMVFKNGKLSNIKQGAKIHSECEVTVKQSKLSDKINLDRVTNLY